MLEATFQSHSNCTQAVVGTAGCKQAGNQHVSHRRGQSLTMWCRCLCCKTTICRQGVVPVSISVTDSSNRGEAQQADKPQALPGPCR